jgi:hypothetical protein
MAFQVFDPVGPRTIFTRLNRFTCVTARASLCLRFAHVVTSMNARLDSRWGGSFPLPGRELHPLEAPGLPWRTEIASQVDIDHQAHPSKKAAPYFREGLVG